MGAWAQSALTPEAAPVGANDWTCVPSAAHPHPVVLAHGTSANAYSTWSGLAPVLKRQGYCVFALNFGRSDPLQKGGLGSILPGFYGSGPIEDSAKELARYVDAVLAATGAPQVDIVAHSQGGLVARQYLRFEGGTGPGGNKVGKLVTLAATNHGTTLSGIASLDRVLRDGLGVNLDPLLDYPVGVSGVEQVFDSPFLRNLNAGGDTEPGIDYTVLATRYDEVSSPYEWTFLTPGPGATVQNITVQDRCPSDFSEHLSLNYSPHAIGWVEHALDPAGFGVEQIRCTANTPLFGDSSGA